MNLKKIKFKKWSQRLQMIYLQKWRLKKDKKIKGLKANFEIFARIKNIFIQILN